MTSVNASKTDEETHGSRVDLDSCYRQIGISALAAALRYRSDCKNPAYAPIEPDLSAAGFEVNTTV